MKTAVTFLKNFSISWILDTPSPHYQIHTFSKNERSSNDFYWGESAQQVRWKKTKVMFWTLNKYFIYLLNSLRWNKMIQIMPH